MATTPKAWDRRNPNALVAQSEAVAAIILVKRTPGRRSDALFVGRIRRVLEVRLGMCGYTPFQRNCAWEDVRDMANLTLEADPTRGLSEDNERA